MAERRIAPNLIPHTGPTGGGDSKVDSETFPVSDVLALGWFDGIGREASKERWGFALSAKKDWRTKLKSDISKLVATDRGYTKAFFITNQYVKDKTRATLEDQLSRKYRIEVRVLDLNWVLDTVFEGHHEEFAIGTLGLSPDLRPEIKRGPRDTEREERLAELENRIQDALRAGKLNSRVVRDALRSATTARGLERARTDIDGRFLRARDLAERLGGSAGLLQIVYQWAWTAFFWYEDYGRFAALANESFEMALGSENANDLQMATTLLGLLNSAITRANLSVTDTTLDDYASRILARLDEIGNNKERPSNALQAQTLAIQTRLILDPNRSEALLKDMLAVIERAEPLIGYPFERTAELVGALEPVFGDLSAYSTLFERIVEITGARQGDVTAAQMLLKRGAQQLERDNSLDAIRSFGRALGRLYKDESRDDLIQALFLAGSAYDRLDLTWAARGSLVTAASLATDQLHRFGSITRQQVACYDRLRWIELQLGRLPQALEWHQLSVLASQAVGVKLPPAEVDMFDAVVGIHMLRADLYQLRELENLPDILEGLGLFMARSALLFSLGQPSDLPDDLFDGEDRSRAEYKFMQRWRDQPATDELRPLSLGSDDCFTMESNILGCHVVLSCAARSPAVHMAESLLAALESLLSTGLDSRMAAREPLLRITVRTSELADPPFGFHFEYDLGRPHIHVACRSFDPNSLSHQEQAVLKSRLVDLLIHTFAHIVMTPDATASIRRLFGDEHALERSVSFTNVFITLGNVLGPHPKTSITDWIKPDGTSYHLTRDKKWDTDDHFQGSTVFGAEKEASVVAASKTSGFPPPAKHSDLRTISLIREKLWNEAGWSGAGYFGWEGSSLPPTLALLFQNPDAAIEIFRGWQEELGADDADELLRISIVRGISVAHPTHYRMVIGTELTAIKDKITPVTGRILSMSRIHTMEPRSSENLDRFLNTFGATKSYKLAPGIADADRGPLIGQPHLTKRKLYIRNAWEIGPTDPDSPAICVDDVPIIPNDLTDIPVHKLLRWLRDR